MDIYKDVNIVKFKTFPRVENIAIDPSALSTFKWCPRAYWFRYVLGYKPREDEVYLTWGSAVHKFYEVAEKEYKKVPVIPVAVVKAIAAAVEVWGKTKDPLPESKFAFMTKARLSDVLLYLARMWQKEKEQKQFIVHQSELSYLIQLPFGQWISGKIDQIIEEAKRNLIRDFKTTSKKWYWYKRGLNPSDQFICYVYAGREITKSNITGANIDVVLTSKEEGPKLEREPILFSENQIGEWVRGREQWSRILDSCRETDSYPMNERNCPSCAYFDVCKTRDENSQMFLLKSKYKHEPWDPSTHDDERSL